MKCSLCGRLTPGERLMRGWKICADRAFCKDCRRQRYRLRSLTVSVEPIESAPQESRVALEDALSHTARLIFHSQAWELVIVDSQPVVRLSMGNRWAAMHLNSGGWPPARWHVFESIASGKVAAGDLVVCRKRTGVDRSPQRARSAKPARPRIVCKTVAWLPRQSATTGPQPVRRSQANGRANPRIRDLQVREIDLCNLRRAIRANWITFPSQLPAFSGCGPPDLARKLAQLYFVMGWAIEKIATRYGLCGGRVACVLNAWKARAAEAGYLQHIPPADVIKEPLVERHVTSPNGCGLLPAVHVPVRENGHGCAPPDDPLHLHLTGTLHLNARHNSGVCCVHSGRYATL